jgi:hypothetical protein
MCSEFQRFHVFSAKRHTVEAIYDIWNQLQHHLVLGIVQTISFSIYIFGHLTFKKSDLHEFVLDLHEIFTKLILIHVISFAENRAANQSFSHYVFLHAKFLNFYKRGEFYF